MIAEIGHFALILALTVALVQATLPMIGAARDDGAWMALARPAAGVQWGCVVIAFAALTHAYVTSDFSVLNVANNSHSAKPLLYKISGVWGNHEGSLLLWVLILATFGGAVALFGGNLPPTLRARVLSVQALIAIGFLLFTLTTSNPFERLVPAPMDGADLNPLLQDPGLAFHPPFLYLGYVGFSIAFAFAMAALIEGRVDVAWARWVRPWTLAAWSFLTLGIALGSWWAYYELGWGGWWFWDPVENASFMPWLAGTALLHSSIVCEKRGALRAWTILLAIIAFSFSLLGTFLVRSGVLTSVHAFATDPARGVFILAFLVIVVGGSLALFAIRAPQLKGGGLFAPISREGGLVINNLLLTTAAATVLLGTLYPLFVDALGGDKVSVGPPYFNAVFVPLMTPLIILGGIAPLLAWKRADLAGVLGRLRLVGVATAIAVVWALWSHAGGPVLAGLGIGLATWLAASAAREWAHRVRLFAVPPGESLRRAFGLPRAAYGMTIAHLGVACVIAGITASSAWRVESLQVMRPGESVAVAGYDFTLLGVDNSDGPNYAVERGHVTVARAGAPVAELWPEKRFYPVQQRPTTEAAIHTTWFADLYFVVGDSDGRGGWSTRIYYNPLVPWIWLGAVVMALGGAVSLSDRRHRVGAPTRSRARAAPALAPEAGT
ncbi:MAG: heme lyase CcmF/NrfE family subunit [Alphaproteobacteria bacterium]|jgi:cytochrome c-type biogenesis protein CcmF|nr:heme lyase CcmF/NrfE family subunit [Alphaproteobacteria bacterium]